MKIATTWLRSRELDNGEKTNGEGTISESAQGILTYVPAQPSMLGVSDEDATSDDSNKDEDADTSSNGAEVGGYQISPRGNVK